jgi:hypothetical protein
MTAFMESIVTIAKQLRDVSEDEIREVGIIGAAHWLEGWGGIEKRFGCAMIQARAQECRQQATNLIVNKPMLVNRVAPEMQLPFSLALDEIAKGLMERSHYLERIGVEVAQGPWPPVEVADPEGMVQ